MMRKIKFRAQDKYSNPNKMVQPNNGDLIGWHAPSNWKDCYEIMQFTGLLDKQGKEIYEGDIVKRIELDIEEISFIKYTNHGFKIDREYFGYEGEGLWDWNEIEIIGNIHQNPELLKP